MEFFSRSFLTCRKMSLLLFIAVYHVLQETSVRAEVPVLGPIPSVSKDDASGLCLEEGTTLLSYNDINAGTSTSEYLDQIHDGESAWIDGYATLSKFLSWQGCFSITDLNLNFKTSVIEKQSVFMCVAECTDSAYIGLLDTTCYCISESKRPQMQFGAVNDSSCSIRCNVNKMDSCGGNSYMSVYGVLDDRRINWGANEPSSHLCVYVKSKLDWFEAFTASCHTLQLYLINGYICTNSAWSRVSTGNCSRLTTTKGTYCIIEDIVTRQEASERCLNKGGILAGLGAEATTPVLLTNNFRYWLGIHRTFRYSDLFKNGETLCLSLTRVGNRLYIEPDDCIAQKTLLCKGQLQSDKLTPPAPPVSPTDVASQSSGTSVTQSPPADTTTVEMTKITQSFHQSSPGMSVPAFILSVVAVVASLVCVTLVTIMLRRVNMVKAHNNTGDAMYITPTVEPTPYYVTVS